MAPIEQIAAALLSALVDAKAENADRDFLCRVRKCSHLTLVAQAQGYAREQCHDTLLLLLRQCSLNFPVQLAD